jgi:hypothetical protein
MSLPLSPGFTKHCERRVVGGFVVIRGARHMPFPELETCGIYQFERSVVFVVIVLVEYR